MCDGFRYWHVLKEFDIDLRYWPDLPDLVLLMKQGFIQPYTRLEIFEMKMCHLRWAIKRFFRDS